MSFEEDYGYLFDDEYATEFTPTVDFAQNYAKSLALDRGLPADNFVRQIGLESGWNPYAKGAAGEVGYGQFMPQTAQNLGVVRDNPIKNLTGSADFMADLTSKYGGDYGKAAMAYNAGEGAVDSGRIPDMSKNYAAKVLGSAVPQAPSFGAYKNSAGLPTPAGRQQDLAALDEEVSGLETIKRQALGQMGRGTNLSGQNTLAVALTALLPALIGMGMHGKEGLAQGFNAGAAGAGVGLQGFAAEAKEKDAANTLLYKDAATQLAAKKGEMKGVRDSIRDREEKNVELEYSYGSPGGVGGVRSRLSANSSYTPEIQDALAKAESGQELTPEETRSVYSNTRAADDLNNIYNRQGIDARGDKNRDLRGRIPDVDRRKVTGNKTSTINYRELGNLVRGKDINTERIAQIMGEVQGELAKRGYEEFTADGYDGLFNRVLAKSGLDPNSYDYQVLERMKQIGRANAIAQPGVATNEDALQEIGFVSIKPGQSIDNYLSNLARLGEGRMRETDILLKDLELNGYPYAKIIRESLMSEGLIKGSDESSGSGVSNGGLIDTGKRDAQGRRIMREG